MEVCESTGVLGSLRAVTEESGVVGVAVFTLNPSLFLGTGGPPVVGEVPGTRSKISGTGALRGALPSSGDEKGDERTGLKVVSDSGPQISS